MTTVRDGRRAPRWRRLAAAVLATSAVVGFATACGGGSDEVAGSDPTSGAGEGTFPVRIESALGTAEIDAPPERIATWGWSNQDALLALGVVPVAMPTFSGPQYGSDERGILPWDAAALEEAGAPTPTLLDGDGTGEAPIEQFAAAEPDLIFAPYSGLTRQEYDALSAIAPVVAHPDVPWTASWQEQVTLAGDVLGRPQDAAAVVDRVNREISEHAATVPDLAGRSVTMALPTGPATFAVSKGDDVRVEFLEQWGLENEQTIGRLDTSGDEEAVYFELSTERASEIASDILFVAAYDKPALDGFLTSPVVAAQPVVRDGRTASTRDFTVAENFAFGGLTALTIPYILDKLTAALGAAAANVR